MGLILISLKNKKTVKKRTLITIGTIKNLSKVYGIDILIKVLQSLIKNLLEQLALAKKMRLKIVGSGDQKEILLDLISSLDLKNIVSLKDRVKHKLVPIEMEEISIFVLLADRKVLVSLY